MESDVLGLEEVVVIGYGQMRRSDLTGSVVSVSSEAIQQSISTSIDQVLRVVQQEYKYSKIQAFRGQVRPFVFEESIR